MTLIGIWRRLRVCVYTALTLAGVAALVGVVLFYYVLRDLPRLPEPLSRIIETPATEIFAANGERILSIGGRQYVPLHRVSRSFVQAILATEDHRFWEHRGINKLRTLKALWVTLFEEGKVQGASTITQQVAKNLLLGDEYSVTRKLKEMILASRIEGDVFECTHAGRDSPLVFARYAQEFLDRARPLLEVLRREHGLPASRGG